MMKPTFLNQNRPLITGMILKDNPDIMATVERRVRQEMGLPISEDEE